MEDLLTRILSHYGLNKEDYARYARKASFSSIPTLHGHKGVEEAKSIILQAIEKKEKILVYGDYDTDGIMATSIMTRLLRKIKGRVSFYIPSRYSDGYGLTMENAAKIASNGYKLVILVDNGITLIEQILFLKGKGIKVIVIDHHEQLDVLPPADAIIHHDYSSYGDTPVSAGYLSFIFSLEFIGFDDYLMCLGALSILSDMMPLKSHNREIVRLMLDSLNDHPYEEFTLLSKKTRFDEKSLMMQVIPQINAVGRMDEDHKILRVIHYFADEINPNKPTLASWMNEINERRKTLTKIAAEKLVVSEKEPAVLVMGNLPEGLNGLLANRLLAIYQKPIAVFSPASSDPSCYVGSIRSLEGFDFMEAKRFLEPYLVRAGGHALAGGMTVKKEDYPAFKEAFLTFSAAHPCKKQEKTYIPLLLEEANFDTLEIIKALGPYGQGFPEPEFCLSRIPISSLRFTQNGGYLSSPISMDAKLFSFSYKKEEVDARCKYCDFSCTFALNEYRGRQNIDLQCTLLRQYE